MAKVKKSEKQSQRYVLRKIVLDNDGVIPIIPDVLRTKSFRGWEVQQIRALVYQLRKEFTDGEIWALYKGTIYAHEESLPPEFWRKICDRRAIKISGVADQNRIYEAKYKKLRTEDIAQKALNNNIQVLGKTMQSSIKVVKTLEKLEPEKDD